MKIKTIAACWAFVVLGALSVHAQQAGTGQDATQNATELRVSLTAQPVALDAQGRPALAARLMTTTLNGAPDAPVQNTRLVFENRSPFFYMYASGWVTFYNGDGVRCGEGLFKLDALAANESAETDLPGLRLRCTPVSWRIVATNLVTRTGEATTLPTTTPQEAATSVPAIPPLEIDIDGETHPIQLGNPLRIKVGRREVRITVNTAP